jgi:hypothetical protein
MDASPETRNPGATKLNPLDVILSGLPPFNLLGWRRSVTRLSNGARKSTSSGLGVTYYQIENLLRYEVS